MHRRVEARTSFLGKRTVRVTLAESVVDIKVSTAAAQGFWVRALQHRVDASPVHAPIPRRPVARVRRNMIQALIDRSDLECAASQLEASRESAVTRTPATPLVGAPVFGFPAMTNGGERLQRGTITTDV